MDPPSTSTALTTDIQMITGTTPCPTTQQSGAITSLLSPTETVLSPGGTGTHSLATSREEEDSSNQASDCKSPEDR